MLKKYYSYISLGILVVLFGALYLLGFVNLFFSESDFLQNNAFINFGSPVLSLFYIIGVTIFFVLFMSIMLKVTSTTSLSSNGGHRNNENTSHELDKKLELLLKTYNIKNQHELISKVEMIAFQDKIDSAYMNISSMVEDLGNASTNKELLEKGLQWGYMLTNSERASLMVMENTTSLTLFKALGWKAEGKVSVTLEEAIAGKVAKEQRTLFIPDLSEYEEYDFPNKDKYKTDSLISVPILTAGRTAGVLNFTESKKDGYSISDVESAKIIGSLLSKYFELNKLKR